MTIEELTFEAFKQGREQGREESAAEIERLREALKHWVFLYAWKAESMNIEQAKIHADAFMMSAALQPKEG
jgi:hypothetical protein